MQRWGIDDLDETLGRGISSTLASCGTGTPSARVSGRGGENFNRALSWYRTRPPEEDVRFGLAQASYEAEQWDEAGALFDELAAEAPDDLEYLGWRGVSLAQRGVRDAAMQLDQQLSEFDPTYLLGGHTLWRARIAAVLGDGDGAVRLLEQANREGFPVAGRSAFHRIMDFEPLRDDRSFQELVRAKG